MERFIYGGVSIIGQPVKRGSVISFTNPVLKPVNYRPTFKVQSLDIETGRNGTVYCIGMFTTLDSKEDKQVLMRSKAVVNGTKEGYITYYNNEKDLLEAFIREFRVLDPDIIIGWHIIGFDFEFLARRCEKLNVQFNLGRNNSKPFIKNNSRNWSCSINGRVVIDGPPTLRGAFYSFESYKLDSVAHEVLGIGKDISDSGKVDEIERRFREDKESLAHYNLLDCTLVADIFNKLGLIDLTFTRAITCGLTMDRIGMSVASFDYFMLPMIHRKGLVAPDVDDIIYSGQGGGGLVFSKEPGFYNSVVVLDFKSLYPSIIRTFLIDPLSRLFSSVDSVTTPVGISFSKSKNVLPSYIKSLMEKRELAKKDDQHLSQAIKILMNSFYGVMGTPGSRFYHPDLPDAITGTGQWLLNRTKEFIEERGYRVLYGDTDSIFVELKVSERDNFDAVGNRMIKEVNSHFSEYLLKEFGVESLLELEYEKHFRRFFLPGLRGGQEGAKKRYAGLMTTKNGEKLTFTGLEFVRSDWTPLAKEFQYNLFKLVFSDKSVEDYVKQIVKDLKTHILDDKLIYTKRLTKPAGEYTKNIPPQVRAALISDPTGSIRGKFKYLITTDGPIPAEHNPVNIDYNHYIDKQLKPIADSILPFIGRDFETIVFKKQPDLFF